MKKIILSVVLFQFVFEMSFAQTVLFPHPFFNTSELSSQIKKDGISFSHYYLQTHPTLENEQTLLKFFEEAQKYYAVKSNEAAFLNYQKVAKLAFVDDWKEIHRASIVLSFLRLAELDPVHEDEWMLRALSFGSDIDLTQFELQSDLKKKLTKTTTLASIDWDLSVFKNSFDYILINGRSISLEKTAILKIPQGEYRIVFVSDKYKPHLLQVSYQQIPFIQPIQIPFVSGTCKKPLFQEDSWVLREWKRELLFADCHLEQKNQAWVPVNTPSLEKLLPAETSPFSQTYNLAQERPIYKRPWFIAAAIAVVGFGIYYVVDQQKSKKGSDTSSSTVLGEF